jgi:hypothetical protein
MNLLISNDTEAQDYAMNFFADSFPYAYSEPPRKLVRIVKTRLNEGKEKFKNMVEAWKNSGFDDERDKDDPWVATFADALSEFKAIEPVAEVDDSSNEVPF